MISGENLQIKVVRKSGVNATPDVIVRSKIIDLKEKKRRGLELDQEKVMKKVVEHMIANIPEGLLSKEEMDIIYLDYIERIGYGKKFDDVKKMFGFTKMYIPSDEMLESLLKSDPKDLGQFVRISLLDTYKSSFQHSTKSKTILTHLAKSWCPDVLKQAELEQEEVKIKREARIDIQIKELEKEVK